MGLLDKVGGAISSGLKKVGNAVVSTKVGKVVADTIKTGLEIPNESYKSLSGDDLVKIKYDTKVGATAGGINKVGIQTGHTALKAYANTVTGGYAEKLHVALVDDYDPRKPDTKVFNGGVLSKFENTTKTIAPIVGQLGASFLNKPKEPAALGKPAGNTGVAGGLGLPNTVPSNTNMSIIGNVTSFAQTDIGKAATGILGGVVNNLLAPRPQAPSVIPQQVLFTQPKMTQIEQPKMTAAQKALGGVGVQVQLPGGSGSASTGSENEWVKKIPVWGWIAIVVVGGPILAFILISMARSIFKRR